MRNDRPAPVRIPAGDILSFMASRNAPFLVAALTLVVVLVAGILASNSLTRESHDLHGPVGCIALVPAVLIFASGFILLAFMWRKQRR